MTYRVVVTREGPYWLINVPEVPSAFSDSLDIRLLDTYAREVVVLALDDPDEATETYEFAWVLDVPTRDLAREFGNDWSLADVAAALNAPVDRVTHSPPVDEAANEPARPKGATVA